jgi:CAAX protease family protein
MRHNHIGSEVALPKEPAAMKVSTMIARSDGPHAIPLRTSRTSVPIVRAGLRPWGFWGSLGWGLLAQTTGVFVAVGVFGMSTQSAIPNLPAGIAIVTETVTMAVSLAVLIILVKSGNFSLREYFSLNRFSRRDLFLGIACLTVLLLVEPAMEWLLGLDSGVGSFAATYRTAKLVGELPILWLALVVVAPVSEELLFRGFLHRGWAPSWLGVSGTIVLTSVLWALLHQQYNWFGILWVFLVGLIFGCIRQRSGSTTLTIMLHALYNLFVTIVLAVQIEWFS